MQNNRSPKISVMTNKGPLIFSSPIFFCACDPIWLPNELRGAIKKNVLEVTLNGTNTCLYYSEYIFAEISIKFSRFLIHFSIAGTSGKNQLVKANCDRVVNRKFFITSF